MTKSVTIQAINNDALIKFCELDGAIDEIHVQIAGDESWIVISYEDLKSAIKQAEFLFSKGGQSFYEMLHNNKQKNENSRLSTRMETTRSVKGCVRLLEKSAKKAKD